MPYTLQQARANQDKAKHKADEATDNMSRRYYMSDVMFWTGYISAMIDHDYPPRIEVNRSPIKDFTATPGGFVNVPYRVLDQEVKLGGNGIMDTKPTT